MTTSARSQPSARPRPRPCSAGSPRSSRPDASVTPGRSPPRSRSCAPGQPGTSTANSSTSTADSTAARGDTDAGVLDGAPGSGAVENGVDQTARADAVADHVEFVAGRGKARTEFVGGRAPARQPDGVDGLPHPGLAGHRAPSLQPG